MCMLSNNTAPNSYSAVFGTKLMPHNYIANCFQAQALDFCLSLLLSTNVIKEYCSTYSPVADPTVLVTCRVISVSDTLLNISTGCAGTSSLILYDGCSKLTTITETRKNAFLHVYVLSTF